MKLFIHTVLNWNDYSFHDAYSFPFTAGVDFGYAFSQNIEFFLNGEFIHGAGKRIKLYHKPMLRGRFSDFNQVALYLGSRYYWDVADWVSPFVGLKAGYVFRERTELRLEIAELGVTNNAVIKQKFAHGSSAFGGGLQLGLDFMTSEIFSIQLMGEAIASTRLNSKRKTKDLVYQTSNAGVYSGAIRLSKAPQTTFSFPVTFGCKFRF